MFSEDRHGGDGREEEGHSSRHQQAAGRHGDNQQDAQTAGRSAAGVQQQGDRSDIDQNLQDGLEFVTGPAQPRGESRNQAESDIKNARDFIQCRVRATECRITLKSYIQR